MWPRRLSALNPPLATCSVGTCEASRFYSNSNRTSRFEFDSKVTCRFENFESAAHVLCRHTTNYAHSLVNKNINLCAVCSWDLCLQLHFTCSCTSVDRAPTQLPHDNRHWTCKRLPPDSIRDSIRYSNRSRRFDSIFDSNGNFRFAGPYHSVSDTIMSRPLKAVTYINIFRTQNAQLSLIRYPLINGITEFGLYKD